MNDTVVWAGVVAIVTGLSGAVVALWKRNISLHDRMDDLQKNHNHDYRTLLERVLNITSELGQVINALRERHEED